MTPPRFIQTCDPARITQLRLLLIAFTVGLVLIANSVHAANLLVNPSFEQNPSTHAIPLGWTRFAPPTAEVGGNYWIEGPEAQDGSQHFKEWGACYNGTNNAAGIYQEFSSAPGSSYQASGWCYTRSSDLLGADCRTWSEVSFLGASSNVLALYKSADFSASVGADTWLQYQVTNVCDLSAPLASGGTRGGDTGDGGREGPGGTPAGWGERGGG